MENISSISFQTTLSFLINGLSVVKFRKILLLLVFCAILIGIAIKVCSLQVDRMYVQNIISTLENGAESIKVLRLGDDWFQLSEEEQNELNALLIDIFRNDVTSINQRELWEHAPIYEINYESNGAELIITINDNPFASTLVINDATDILDGAFEINRSAYREIERLLMRCKNTE